MNAAPPASPLRPFGGPVPGGVILGETSGLVLTRYRGFPDVLSWPQDRPEDKARAASLGYDDLFAMCREHEVGHHILAHALGLPQSPTMLALARRQAEPAAPYWPHWSVEEAAVLALQRYARAVRVDLVRRLSTMGDR